MDVPHDPTGRAKAGATGAAGAAGAAGAQSLAAAPPPPSDSPLPVDDDERFIIGLVLTYYRRHPQRARNRLLDLLGEVLMPAAEPPAPAAVPPLPAPRAATRAGSPAVKRPAGARADDPHDLWLQAQAGTAPLKKKR